MTHPYGQHWEQPDRSRILVDEKHALMTESTFKLLAEYSGTIPTGVYEGKMWKRHDGIFDPRCPVSKRKWMLGWYGTSDDPDKCSTNFREILFV